MPWSKRAAMRLGNWLLSARTRRGPGGWLARRALRVLPKGLVYNPANAWGRARDLPDPPRESFAEWYAKHGHTTERQEDRPS